MFCYVVFYLFSILYVQLSQILSVSHWCFLLQDRRASQCVDLSHFLSASSHQWSLSLLLFSLLWIVLPYAWLCIYLFDTISFPLGTYPLMGIARSYISSIFNFLDSSILFIIMTALFSLIPVKIFLLSPHPHWSLPFYFRW